MRDARLRPAMVLGDNNGLGEGWAWALIDLCLCTYYRLSRRFCQPTRRRSFCLAGMTNRGSLRKRGKRTKLLPHPRATTTLVRFLDQSPALDRHPVLGRPACGASCG